MVPQPLITSDPERMSGVPCFTGTRVPVATLLDHLAEGDTLDQFLRSFPSVTREHAVAVLRAAFDTVTSPASGYIRYEHRIGAR
jgi:uncharacterized protein (DUF433 family)